MDFPQISPILDHEQLALSASSKNYEGAELLKIVLIDSVVSGKIVEMPISGGTVLTGRNGSGKTTYLQLISFFYGESPNQILSANSQKLPFVPYYLPNTTSYIVFEYQRSPNSKRTVAVYSDRAGDRPIYRFIRHGFDRRMFVDEEAQMLIPAADLVKHLKKNSFQCEERQIETCSDYRGVIQGIQTHSSDRQYQRYLRELTKDYSLTTTHPLRQIDKVVNGMFSRQTDFDDLLNMVVSCVSDENTSLNIDVDKKKFEQWPRDYRSFLAVKNEVEHYQKASDLDNELSSIENSLGQIKGKLKSFVKHTQQNIVNVEKEKKDLETNLDTAREKMVKEKSELTIVATTQKTEAETKESQVTSLDNTFNDYQRQEIQKAIKATEDAEATYQKRDARRQELSAIDLGQQAIISFCDSQKGVIKDRLVSNLTDVDRKIEEARARAQKQIGEIEEEYETKEMQHSASDEQNIALLRDSLSELENRKGQAEYAYNHPTVPQELLKERERKNAALMTAKDDSAKAQKTMATHQQNYQEAILHYEKCEQARNSAENNLNIQKEKLTLKNKKLNPEEGTLLHFLRAEKPDWSFDIARVINDDLLARSDLEPSIISESFSCYGLELNLDKLLPLPESDISELTAEIERAEETVKMAEMTLNQRESELSKANESREKMDKAKALYQQELKSIQNNEKTLDLELREVSRQVEKAEKEIKITAKEKLDEIIKSYERKKSEIAKTKEIVKDNKLSRKNQRNNAINEKKQFLENYCSDQNNRKKLHIQTAEDECYRLDNERDAQLKANGIDTSARNNVERELKALEANVAFIEKNRTVVERYKQWLRTDYSQRNTLQAQATEFRRIEQETKDKITELDREWGTVDRNIHADIYNLKVKLEKLGNGISEANKHISGLMKYAEFEIDFYDQSWTLDALISLKNQNKSEEIKLNEQIVNELRFLFRKFKEQDKTPPAIYAEQQSIDYTSHVSREWLPLFKNWYEHEQIELQRLLQSESITIASSIRSFHRNMKDFNSKVLKFNRELQENLDTNLSFSSITEVCIEIVCTLTELKYWPAITAMAEIEERWSGLTHDDLPPIEFAHGLEILLDSWEIKSGIKAELRNLIRIQGHVIENGSRREFKRSSDLKNISSKGLSYLIMSIVFVAFINRIRRGSPVNITWAVDELKEIDVGNVISLVDMLKRNNITLVSAFPDPDPLTLDLFKHSFSVNQEHGLMAAKFNYGDWGDVEETSSEEEYA